MQSICMYRYIPIYIYDSNAQHGNSFKPCEARTCFCRNRVKLLGPSRFRTRHPLPLHAYFHFLRASVHLCTPWCMLKRPSAMSGRAGKMQKKPASASRERTSDKTKDRSALVLKTTSAAGRAKWTLKVQAF